MYCNYFVSALNTKSFKYLKLEMLNSLKKKNRQQPKRREWKPGQVDYHTARGPDTQSVKHAWEPRGDGMCRREQVNKSEHKSSRTHELQLRKMRVKTELRRQFGIMLMELRAPSFLLHTSDKLGIYNYLSLLKTGTFSAAPCISCATARISPWHLSAHARQGCVQALGL